MDKRKKEDKSGRKMTKTGHKQAETSESRKGKRQTEIRLESRVKVRDQNLNTQFLL